MAILVRAGLWRRLDRTGLERFELLRESDRWLLRGTILVHEGRGALEARYEVDCDAAWRTTRAEVRVSDAKGERRLELGVEHGVWYAAGREIRAVRGALDVDLGWSPSTNALPIRRLGLRVGERSGRVVAAWVRFPELGVEPLEQEYERRSESGYRYSSRGGSFVADLEVDREALVVSYGEIWERVRDSG